MEASSVSVVGASSPCPSSSVAFAGQRSPAFPHVLESLLGTHTPQRGAQRSPGPKDLRQQSLYGTAVTVRETRSAGVLLQGTGGGSIVRYGGHRPRGSDMVASWVPSMA